MLYLIHVKVEIIMTGHIHDANFRYFKPNTTCVIINFYCFQVGRLFLVKFRLASGFMQIY